MNTLLTKKYKAYVSFFFPLFFLLSHHPLPALFPISLLCFPPQNYFLYSSSSSCIKKIKAPHMQDGEIEQKSRFCNKQVEYFVHWNSFCSLRFFLSIKFFFFAWCNSCTSVQQFRGKHFLRSKVCISLWSFKFSHQIKHWRSLLS